jgi:3-dehydroquinate synthase
LDTFDLICQRELSVLYEVIQDSLAIKLDFIANDEFDLGRRNMLNYGHCIGHAIESTSNFRIPHGQAIVAGMILANRIAVQREILSKEKGQFLEEKLLRPILKSKLLPADLQPEAVIHAMGKDKKRVGSGLVLVMLSESGEMIRINDLAAHEVTSALKATEHLLLFE